MDNPKISVIVPVYNVEQYLPRCIDSILAQTFTDFELLLIDDGSTDNSGKICDEYAEKDQCIKAYHTLNNGSNSARKIGVHNAQSKYVVFVDADDDIPITALAAMYTISEKQNIDILVTAKKRVGKKTYCIKNKVCGLVSQETYVSSMLKGEIFIGPHGRMIKRELFSLANALDIPKEITNNEDLIMNLNLGTQAKRICINNDLVTYNYYIRPQSVSTYKKDLYYWTKVFDIIHHILTKSYNYMDNQTIIDSYYFMILNRLANSTLKPVSLKRHLLQEIKCKMHFNWKTKILYLSLKYPLLSMPIKTGIKLYRIIKFE